MAPIGLAHRPVEDAVHASGHGDPDRGSEPEARLHEIVERRRREAPVVTAGPDRPDDRDLDEPSAEGWLAGEPLF